MPIPMKNKILITGGTGLVGTQLIELLLSKGYEINVLTRKVKPSDNQKVSFFEWNIDKEQIDEKCFDEVDTIINLAGAGVADKPWTEKQKKIIRDSRTNVLNLLYKSILKLDIKINHLISASATGYYGSDDTQLFTELDQPGNDFLASVVKDWEVAADKFENVVSKITKLRIGIVLSTDGGALAKIIEPIKFWAGAPLGKGTQPMSWIHISDLCNMFLFVKENELPGTFNAVVDTVTNEKLTKVCAKQLDKPLFLPNVPGFVLKIALGEMSEIVLKGVKVSGEHIKSKGFTPNYTTIEGAVEELL